MSEKNWNRRKFIKTLGIAGVGTFLGGSILAGCERGPRSPELKEGEREHLLSIDITNAFPTNKSEMNELEKEKFIGQIKFFIEKIVREGRVKELADARIYTSVSSDERWTSSWERGNEGLSQARMAEVKKIYNKLITELSVQHPELKEFFRKRIISDIPVSPQYGRGVTSITDLINLNTGKRYTEEEIRGLSSSEKQALYKKCRYVRFDIIKPAKKDREEQYNDLINKISGFPIVRFLIDRSDSMYEEIHRLGDKMSEQLVSETDFSDADKAVVTFGKKIDFYKGNYVRIKTREDIKNYIKRIRTGGGHERQLRVANEMIDNLNKEFSDKERGPAAIVVLSDEGINDFDLSAVNDLIQKSKENNVRVFFSMINNQNKLITTFTPEDLLEEFKGYVEQFFDDDAYFPKDGMSQQEKLKYFMEQIREADRILATSSRPRGVQVNTNGNLDFVYYTKEIKENIAKRYRETDDKEEKKRLIRLYKKFK